MSTSIHLPLYSLFLLLSLHAASSLNFDGTLLLSFKYSILSDPLSVLANWDYNDATPCFWTGVACAQVTNTLGFPEPFRVTALTLPNTGLVGTIPEDLGFLTHLTTLDLSHNSFTGPLPNSLFNATDIRVLDLSANEISGSIPDLAANAALSVLNLSHNAFTGNVPRSVASSQNLTVVSLRGNRLSGGIPIGIRSLQVLDISSNSLNGSLPPAGFGGENLRYLNLSSNQLAGAVPPGFASRIPANATIDFSFNRLSGEIPASLPLSNQKTEAYAGNADLCGKPVNKLCTVPSTISSPLNVTAANSSSSSAAAIAAIPKTIAQPDSTAGGNPAAPQQHGLEPGAVAGIAVVPLAAVGVLAALILYIHQKKKKNAAGKSGAIPAATAYEFKKESDFKETMTAPVWSCLTIKNAEESSEATGSDSDGDEKNNYVADQQHPTIEKQQLNSKRVLVMVDGETQMEAETLFKASAYVLGSSGATIVYKAVLQDGTAFAVRRIGESGGAGRLKEFEHQFKAVAKLRHQNLVRLRGFYWGEDEKLVISDYVSNGSLSNVGCRNIGSSPYHLPFMTRVNIAKGVARGLAYIHDKKNVHGNIKPSNILLTADMEPVISDFGMHGLIYGKHARKSDGPARHFGSRRSTPLHEDLHENGSPCLGPSVFVGCTSPYHAPESLNNLKPSTKWDVYSFGILLLELMTGKVFSDRDLSQWTVGSVAEDPERVLMMADMAIRGDVATHKEAMLAWFKLAFSCASLVPQKRPCMRDALHVLEKYPCCFQ
ncbi:probable LRR receptor-like serine/threonine-protein kinase At4g37250 [Salvia hispanica]|uniref:probable LRR receptor-like serine/threonine-protein kinase At4g37250 n=1 Tax=Salvia hispanica TaxID=49212 RepID=UPI00200948E7|nr:probable LRR receptor-like serine/threonine-protein kinase At4g37250 [Salvia hispanica]